MSGVMFIKKLLTVLAVIILFIIARLLADQVQYYISAVKHLEKGDRNNAVMHFNRVMCAYLPFSPLTDRSRDAVIKLAEAYKREGELYPALACFEAVRSSMYLTKHLEMPGAERLAMLNSEIAGLKAEMVAGERSGIEYERSYNEQLAIALRDYSPRPFPVIIIVISLVFYLVCGVFWAVTGKRWSAFVSIAMLALCLVVLSAV